MRKHNWTALLCLTALCLGLFAGCGKTETESRAADQRFAGRLGSAPATLDLSCIGSDSERTVLVNVMEGLVRMEGDKPAAAGAEKWTVSSDGLVWTFTLRQNVLWSDGQPVTAGQYVYALRRSAQAEIGCGDIWALRCLKNFEEVYSGALPPEELGAAAIDDHTLQLTLAGPVPGLLMLLTEPVWYPQRAEQADRTEGYLSNGPFLLESMNEAQVVLAKNPGYWDAGSVALEQITLTVMGDRETVCAAFDQGELDAVTVSTEGTAAILEETAPRTAVGGREVASLWFNCADPVFADARIRQAFSLAIDRQALTDAVLDGMYAPAEAWVAPAVPFVGGDRPLDGLRAQLEEDGKSPRDLLLEGMEALGLGNDPAQLELRLILAGQAELGAYLETCWQETLGVGVEVICGSADELYAVLDGGGWQLTVLGWQARYADVFDSLSRFAMGGMEALCGWRSDAYDDLLLRALQAGTESDRLALYAEAQQLLVAGECAVAPIYGRQEALFMGEKLRDYPLSALNGSLREVWIAQ